MGDKTNKAAGDGFQQIMQGHMGGWANPSNDRDRVLAFINHPLLINVSPNKVSNLLRINTKLMTFALIFWDKYISISFKFYG